MADLTNLTANISTATLSCPKCSNIISYYDLKKSKFFGCPQCGSFFERGASADGVLRIFDENDRVPPSFPLGTRGVVDDKEYTLVGYIRKKEADDDVYWTEYAFYHPGEDWYVMLAEYSGHWLLIRRSEKQFFETITAANGADLAIDDDRNYQLYLWYRFKVVSAEGEFDWNVLSDEELITYEYVSAPYLLVNELRDQENSWFRAVYIPPKGVMEMFNVLPEEFPPRYTSLSFDPSKFYPRWRPLFKCSLFILLLFVLLNIFLDYARPAKEVFKGSYMCEPDTASWGNCKPIITQAFEVTGPAPVRFDLASNTLTYNWIELPIVMINDKTGKVYEIDKTIEYYQGYDDGESWSEGSREQKAVLSSVPSGTYHLNIYPYTQLSTTGEQQPSFDVTVTQNAFLGRNFWWMFLAIIIYPVIQFIRKYRFENSKWFDNEYGVYNDQ